MPTRTFIGLIFMVLLLIVAATPALMDPVSQQVSQGMAAAGVPGMAEPTAERQKGKNDGTGVKNELRLKGYDAVKADMVDRYPEGQREIVNSRRLTTGTRRADLPGYFELNPDGTPVAAVKGGMLLDVNSCPVFREGTDIDKIWADKDQKKRYTDKAKAADDPKKCQAHLEDQWLRYDMQKYDQQDLRTMAGLANSSDMGTAITLSYYEMLEEVFPDVTDVGTTEIRAGVRNDLAAASPKP